MPPQAPTPVPQENMDIFDSVTPKGLNASMHAPMYKTYPPPKNPLTHLTLRIIASQDDDNEAFLKALAAVTELNSEAVAVSGHSPNLHFTPPRWMVS